MFRASYVLLFAAVMVFAIALAGCGGGDAETVPGRDDLRDEDLVPEVQVQIVDHNFRVASMTDDNLDSDPIFSIIASATSSLDIAVTRINRQEIVVALLNEAQSGTQIRIVTEKAYYDAPNYRPFYAQLEDTVANAGNIKIRTDLDGLPRTMHSRFLIIDQARVVTGSYNWETVGSDNTFGDVISIMHTGVAAAFTNQFNQMFVEGNFGINKRNDTETSFLLGNGYGMLEVYFGPNDQPRELLMSEINESANIFFAVQQFKDTTLANFMLNWIMANTEGSLFGIFNDFGPMGDQDENLVYNAFSDLVESTDNNGGQVYINDLMDAQDPGSPLNGFNTMNHKLLFADHGFSDGQPAIVFSTANYSDLGFTLNDEIMLVMRYVPMVKKYWRGMSLVNYFPPDEVQEPGDIQEFDQLFCMWPYLASVDAEMYRDYQDVPCGIIFGEVNNFQPTVTVQTGAIGETEDINIDLTFEIDGQLYYTGGTYEGIRPSITGDIFEENEFINPNHRFMLVVPAGEVTLRTVVTDTDGADSLLFQPDETTFEIGPGCVRRFNVKINQAGSGQQGTPGGGGGL